MFLFKSGTRYAPVTHDHITIARGCGLLFLTFCDAEATLFAYSFWTRQRIIIVRDVKGAPESNFSFHFSPSIRAFFVKVATSISAFGSSVANRINVWGVLLFVFHVSLILGSSVLQLRLSPSCGTSRPDFGTSM